MVIDPARQDVVAAVRADLPEGVDFIIDATGNPPPIEGAFDALAPGGTLMMFGVCPAGTKVTFPAHEIFLKEARILGGKMPPGTLDRSARLIESGRIASSDIVTTTLGLDRLSEAVEGFNSQRDRAVKIAIDPWV